MMAAGQDFRVCWGASPVGLGLVETTRPVSWGSRRGKRRGYRLNHPGVQRWVVERRAVVLERREVEAVELLGRVLVVQQRLLVEGDRVLVGVGWVAELLGVPVGSVRVWLRDGRGPPWYKVGYNVRLRRGEVVEWVEACWWGESPGGVPLVLRVNPHKVV